MLGVIEPAKRPINRDTWLFNGNVQMKVSGKHIFLVEKTLATWKIYMIANRDAENVVAVNRSVHYNGKLNMTSTEDSAHSLLP